MYEFSVVNIITTSTARITRHATGSDYLFLMRAAFAVKMPKNSGTRASKRVAFSLYSAEMSGNACQKCVRVSVRKNFDGK